MCHYSRPWMSSDAEVIFPFLFWFIYKWIGVWSNSQYCAALKIKADLSFLHIYEYTFKYINVVSNILSLLVVLVLIWCWVQTLFFLAYVVSLFLPTPCIWIGFPCPTPVVTEDSLAYVLTCSYTSVYMGMEGDDLFHRIVIIK